MIEITSVTAFTLYLGIMLAGLMMVWLYHHIRCSHKKIVTSEKHLIVCEYCRYAYLSDKSRMITKCPQCSSLNKGNVYSPYIK